MMKKTLVFLFVASCAGAQTENERICTLEAIHGISNPLCVPIPPAETCGDGIVNQPTEQCDLTDLAGQTCVSQGFDSGTLACAVDCTFDTSGCVTNPPPPPPPGGALADGQWKSIPTSSMDTLYSSPVDGVFTNFENIQKAWGGATCNEDTSELIVFGGGHGDSHHNGVFAVDVNTGQWRRVTQPSAVWQNVDSGAPNYCPGDVCTPPFGPTCPYGQCNVMPDGTPSSRHSYDLLSYENGYLYAFGGSIWKIGTDGQGPRTWRLNLSTGQWEPLATRPGGILTTGGSAAIGGKIYHAYTSWGRSIYDIATNTWSTGMSQLPFGDHSQLLYVPSVDKLFALSDNIAWSLAPADWPTGTPTNIGAVGYGTLDRGVGLTYYPPEDLILLWDGGQDIQTLDPQTNTWGVVTPGGEDPGVSVGQGTWGRFAYCGGKLILVNGVSNNLFYVDVAQPVASNNFEARCQANGVVFCDPLDTEGPYGADGSVMLNPDGSTGIPTQTWNHTWRGVQTAGNVLPTLDTTVKASGTGSLRFTYPTLSAEGGGGNFVTNFSSDNSVLFGEGSTFYIQYRWRANCDFLYFDCDPNSPSYKKTRRYFRSTSGGKTGFKTAIISGGDVNLPTNQPHCDWLQVVVNHSFDHRVAAYHSCLWYSALEVTLTNENYGGSLQIDRQPDMGPYGTADTTFPRCWYVPGAPDDVSHEDWGHTGPDCFYLDSDEWITIQVMLRIGTWQPDRTGFKTSHVTVWAAHEGEAQQPIIDIDFYANHQYDYERYGKVVLLPLMTNKDPTEQHPTGYVWYDELIVSTQFIEDAA